jgi:tyrosyl-tRNA synthetase
MKTNLHQRNIVEDLKKRGFIDAVSSEEMQAFCQNPKRVYVGFDPTADSLHLGNLVGIIALRWFQLYGHTPYVLMGGATGSIGDPSGKSKERVLLDLPTIEKNIIKISELFDRFLDRSGPQGYQLVNNENWLGKMSMIEFLRDVGKHFRLGPMLGKESVKQRMLSEEGMSFTEFSYQILQGYDFYHLSQHEGVTIQMGGSDQWGNITAGIEFARKMTHKGLYGLTFPLLTRSDGKKFGKSEDGAIFLHAEKTSPYEFYQYFMSIPDSDCIKMMKMLTFLPLEEIEAIEKEHLAGLLPHHHMQQLLAKELTLFVHGETGLEAAKRATESFFGNALTIDESTLAALALELPKWQSRKEEVLGCKFTEVAVKSGLCTSKGEAARLIKNQGATINHQKVEDVNHVISDREIVGERFLLLGSGKKTKIIVEIKT